MTPARFRGRRYLPYKVLAYSIYAIADHITRRVDPETGDMHVSVDTGPFRRSLNLFCRRFGEALQSLDKMGLIRNLETGRGWAIYDIPAPQSWNVYPDIEEAERAHQ